MSDDLIARLRKPRWRDAAHRVHGQYDTNGVEPERLEAAICIERLGAENEALRLANARLQLESDNLREFARITLADPAGRAAHDA